MKIKSGKILLAIFLLAACFTLNAQETVTDIDGNVYPTVTISSQKWMKENLKTTHYDNGDSIPNITNAAAWIALNTGAYCNYNNDSTYVAVHGRLFNGFTVIDSRNLCPSGWHVPTDSDWTTLTTFLGGESVAGGKMKEAGIAHWNSPNTGANNESEFTALPSGGRMYTDGSYNFIGQYGGWWSSTVQDAIHISYRNISYQENKVGNYSSPKQLGFSVRCIEDPIPETAKYLGQTPPGDTAEIFAPDIISNANSHCRLTISPDGKEIFWNVADFNTWESKIYCVTYNIGKWADPVIPSFATEGITANVVFSPDGKKLFFEYREDVNSSWTIKYVEKVDSGWSETKSDGFLIAPSSSFTATGKVYYSDAMANTPWGNGIYAAVYSDTGLSNSQPLPEAINTANIINYTPYIAPDESYLLFASNRPMTGGNDVNMYIYISFNDEGIWSTPQKINDAINFSGKARLPSISPDGKYLFFCGDDNNFYWVDIHAIEQLKPTAINNIPENGNISVFPNPGNGLINVSFNTVQQATIEIYNLQGALVFSNVFINKTFETIDLTENTTGIYIVKVIADGVNFNGKIFKK
jgi:uncharacterized protein (TIGR02145 family)